MSMCVPLQSDGRARVLLEVSCGVFHVGSALTDTQESAAGVLFSVVFLSVALGVALDGSGVGKGWTWEFHRVGFKCSTGSACPEALWGQTCGCGGMLPSPASK